LFRILASNYYFGLRNEYGGVQERCLITDPNSDLPNTDLSSIDESPSVGNDVVTNTNLVVGPRTFGSYANYAETS
jgi:hypothetical protein